MPKDKFLKRSYRERSQPTKRRSGFLEKHKDYVLRAKDSKLKKERLQKLRKLAENRNDDEFYYKMINSKTLDGVAVRRAEDEEYTPAELKLMKEQDINYLQSRRMIDLNNIERLKKGLHNTISDIGRNKNSHIIFVDDDDLKEDGASTVCGRAARALSAAHVHIDDTKMEKQIHKLSKEKRKKIIAEAFDTVPDAALLTYRPTTEQLKNTSIVSTLFSGSAIAKQQRNIKLRERELTQRIHRVNQLDKMIKRMRTKKILTEGKEHAIKIYDTTGNAQYVWKTERKK